MEKTLVGIGACNLDITFAPNGLLTDYDSNRGKLTFSAGGVTRNIIENISRLGLKCRLITALGDDLFADYLKQKCREAGIDTGLMQILSGRATSAYLSFLDEKGEMRLGGCDMDVMENWRLAEIPEIEDELSKAQAVVFDPSIGKENMAFLSGFAPELRLFADPVSADYCTDLYPYLFSLEAIKPNRMELEILSGRKIEKEEDVLMAAQSLLEKGVKNVLVSLGKEGTVWVFEEGYLKARLKEADRLVNASGAGDALFGAWIYGYLQGYGKEEIMDMALSAGILTALSQETVSPEMSENRLKEIRGEYAL